MAVARQSTGDCALIDQHLKELVGAYRAAFNKAGMAESEFWIWYALLIYGGEYTQQDLCALWSLPKQTANTIITRLVREGRLWLETVPGTRNRKRIRLTEEGRRYGEGMVLPIYSAQQRAMDALPEADRGLCVEVLGRYVRAFKEELRED